MVRNDLAERIDHTHALNKSLEKTSDDANIVLAPTAIIRCDKTREQRDFDTEEAEETLLLISGVRSLAGLRHPPMCVYCLTKLCATGFGNHEQIFAYVIYPLP